MQYQKIITIRWIEIMSTSDYKDYSLYSNFIIRIMHYFKNISSRANIT